MSTTAPAFTFSYSHLKNFAACPKKYYHVQVAKDFQEEMSPQLAEGDALHRAFQARLEKRTPLPLAFAIHERTLARVEAIPGTLATELKLGLTEAKQGCAFFAKNVWLRTVIDAVKTDGRTAVIFDWKTGRPSDETTQLALMALTVMGHDPNVHHVIAALVFVNHGHVVREVYDRRYTEDHWDEIMPAVDALREARRVTRFPPRPESRLCRKYCPVKSCMYHGT